MTSLSVSPNRLVPWALIVALWALLHAGLVKIGASPVLDGNLVDPDSFMRLVRVTQLHETGAWYDTSVPRINAPYGDVLHWTRPFDVLLLVGAWALTPFLGFNRAVPSAAIPRPPAQSASIQRTRPCRHAPA